MYLAEALEHPPRGLTNGQVADGAQHVVQPVASGDPATLGEELQIVLHLRQRL